MKYFIEDPKRCTLLLNRFNVLRIKDDKTGYCIFENDCACYKRFMDSFFNSHVSGYFDPILWLVDDFSCSFNFASDCFSRTLKPRFKLADEPFMIDWLDENNVKQTMLWAISAVCFLYDVSFCLSSFNVAFTDFYTFLIKYYENVFKREE